MLLIILHYFLFQKIPFILLGFLSVLLLFKAPSLNREQAERLQLKNPVKVCLLKKHTDWKNDVWWEGTVSFENNSLPAFLYVPRADNFSSGMICHIYDPRINIYNRGYSQRISVSVNDQTSIISGRKNRFQFWENSLEKLREKIRCILLNDNNIRSGFIACGLLLGEKQMIPEPIKEKINRSGISHLFAVSGLHVGFIVLLLSFLLKMAGFNPTIMTILITVFAFFYAFLTPFSSSIFRTVLMVFLFSIAKLTNRKGHILHIVFLSAVVMLLIDSSQLFQVGFWFSYLAVLGILIFYPVISRKIRIKQKIIRYIVDMILVSFAATWGIMPAGVFVFGTVSTMAIFLNIVMIPLVFLMLISIIAQLFLISLPLLGTISNILYSLLAEIFFSILHTVSPYAGFLVHDVRNAPMTIGLWIVSMLIFFRLPRKTVHKLYLYSLIIVFFWILPACFKSIIVISEEDNSLCLRKGKNILMINGTGVESFEYQLLKRFRLYSVKPDILLFTNAYHTEQEQLHFLKKRYPLTKIIAADSLNGLTDIFVRHDTTFNFKGVSLSLTPKSNKLNVLIQVDDMRVGILEFAESMKGADMVLSRKKYSEIRTGTDKFLVVRDYDYRQQIQNRLEVLALKERVEVW